jgi:hypothetical protein
LASGEFVAAVPGREQEFAALRQAPTTSLRSAAARSTARGHGRAQRARRRRRSSSTARAAAAADGVTPLIEPINHATGRTISSAAPGMPPTSSQVERPNVRLQFDFYPREDRGCSADAVAPRARRSSAIALRDRAGYRGWLRAAARPGLGWARIWNGS